MEFTLSENQIEKLAKWSASQDIKAVERQKLNPPNVPEWILKECWDMGVPYGGASGGDLSYEFTPTSLGVAVMVKNNHTGDTIDLTEYELW